MSLRAAQAYQPRGIVDLLIASRGCPAATTTETGTSTMPAYFCSKCRTNWPVGDAYKSCPDCDRFTFHNVSAEPEVVDSVVEHAAVGTQTTDAYAWRLE